MSSVAIFKSSFVSMLRSSIKENINSYLHDEIWVSRISTNDARDMQTSVEIADVLLLDLPEAGSLKDFENATRLHKALRHLTPLQARDPRLWTRMAHVDFWHYMRARWPVDKHMARQDKAVRFVESRYFVPQSQSRALLRNGMARLWWTAQLSHDAERKNPYELTSVLLSTLDITQQILERSMGRATNVLKGFLEFLLRNSDTLLTGGDANRARIRRLAKYLNMYGGVSILDCLTQGEIMEILEAELARIVRARSTSDESDTQHA